MRYLALLILIGTLGCGGGERGRNKGKDVPVEVPVPADIKK